jgi:NAD+ synthase (glutamine-hydrolysing)
MPELSIALAQVSTAVGDIAGNSQKIREYIDRAERGGAHIVVFPELCLTGYPPEDLLLKPEFVRASMDSIEEISSDVGDIIALVGFVESDSDTFNSAAVLARGQLVCTYRKRFLPNYGVFDERRYFGPGDRSLVLDVGGIRVGITICEDIWFPGGPLDEEVSRGGAELVVNLSASPFDRGKYAYRKELVAARSIDGPVFLAFVNTVGGQDELVFDGGSCVHDPQLGFIATAARFREELLLCDVNFKYLRSRRMIEPRFRHVAEKCACEDIRVHGLEKPNRESKPRKGEAAKRKVEELSDIEEIYQALTMGLREYVSKNGFEKVVLGLSGGIDSALTAALAVEALGKSKVICVFLPSRFTSKLSSTSARKMAENLGAQVLSISIDDIFDSYINSLENEVGGEEKGIVFENIQARIRGNLLMALSNRFGWLVLATGNKSELSMGYCTLYGDMAGGFALIKDLFKTQVYELAEYLNEREGSEVIPKEIIEREPSAELSEGQRDTDSLPPYEEMDPILEAYIENGLSAADMVEEGSSGELVERVISTVDTNEYKRRQAPIGVKITSRAFGRDWRMPISTRQR